MNTLTLTVILQLVAAVVIITEVVVPSGGLLGILAAGLIGYSLYTVFTDISVHAGYIFAGIDVAVLPLIIMLGLKLLARSPATLGTELSSAVGVTSQSETLDRYVGKTGLTVSDLRPSGIARIDGRRMDVVSRGEYIARDTPVVVEAATGNQIIVRSQRQPS
ncbi:MAG: NfeD family protein [Thermodesulfobacteriota bacterium]|nr:NfeD family protein [Thermodesulfobacteriota bacterium]